MGQNQIEIPLRKRNRYVYGMVLGVEDFQQEQGYFLDRMRLHNRMLHGWGTVSGLEVSESDDGTSSIVVNAGMAIDAEGNEIFLAEAVRCAFPEQSDAAYLLLYWAERDADPVPAPGDENDGSQTVSSRVEEYAILKYEFAKRPNGIALARLRKSRGKWKIDKKFRVRRVRV